MSVDGFKVWHLDMTVANDTFPIWVNATVNLSAYAGQTVDLAFGNMSVEWGFVTASQRVYLPLILR